MNKFSIIVSVYNTESYIYHCLESILNQTYEDYEIIVVNNGSTDNSKKIIKEYIEKYPNKISQINIKNNELSGARSRGLKKANGDYILFVDSHDSIQAGLLKTLSTKIKDDPDMIRFQVKEVYDNNICMYRELPFETVKSDTAFKKIIKYHYIDNIEFYLYKKEFIDRMYKKVLKNINDNFFALGSFLISQAKKVKSIGYVGYVISKENNTQQPAPMCLLEQYIEFERHLLNGTIDNESRWKTYVTNKLLKETVHLKSKKYKEYLSALNKNNIFNFIEQTGIEKWFICKHPKIYYKVKKVNRGRV